MSYKQPRSVQVVIFANHAGGREYLLLRRISGDGGFWQSVTGSLEESETGRQTAVREVMEETGLAIREEALIELGLTNTFEIAPQWRDRYAPEVTHNEETCFAVKVERLNVHLDPREHDAHVWVDYDKAMAMLYWTSNKLAFKATENVVKEQVESCQ